MARPNRDVAKRLKCVIDDLMKAAAKKRAIALEDVTYCDLEEDVGISHESLRRYHRGLSFPDRRTMVESIATAAGVTAADLSYFLSTGSWPQSGPPTKEKLTEYLSEFSADEQWEIFRRASEKKTAYVA